MISAGLLGVCPELGHGGLPITLAILLPNWYIGHMEQLLEELQDYVYECDIFGKRVSHPLVHVIGLFDIGMINKMYIQKKNATERALENKEYSTYIYLHEKPYRISAFDEIADSLSDEQYWALLGDVCVGTENMWQDKYVWRSLLESDRASSHLIMNEDEYEEYKKLNETLTVYRGCTAGQNEDGFSWTLDASRAKWFSERLTLDDDEPIVLERTIKRDDAIAYFTRRGESEILLIDNYY